MAIGKIRIGLFLIVSLYSIFLFSDESSPAATVFHFGYYGDDYYFSPDVEVPWVKGEEPPYILYSPREGFILKSVPSAIRKDEVTGERIFEISVDNNRIEVALKAGNSGYRLDHIHEDGRKETINQSTPDKPGTLSLAKDELLILFGKDLQILNSIRPAAVDGSELCAHYDVMGAARVQTFSSIEAVLPKLISLIRSPDEEYYYMGAEDINYPRDIDSYPNALIISELENSEFVNLSHIETVDDDNHNIQLPTIDWIRRGQTEKLQLFPAVIERNEYPYKAFYSDPIEYGGRIYRLYWSKLKPNLLQIKPEVAGNKKEPRIYRSYFYHLPANSQHPLWNQRIQLWYKNSAE